MMLVTMPCRRILFTIIFLVCFLFAFCGCSKVSQQEQLSIDAVSQLREQFNGGNCQAFFERSDPRKEELRQLWIDGCQQLRATLGTWQSLDAIKVQTLRDEPLTVMIQGHIVFVSGGHYQNYWLESYWHVIDSEP